MVARGDSCPDFELLALRFGLVRLSLNKGLGKDLKLRWAPLTVTVGRRGVKEFGYLPDLIPHQPATSVTSVA